VIQSSDIDAGGVENVATAAGLDPAGDPVDGTSDAGTDPTGAPVPNPEATETPSPLGINPNDPGNPSDDPTTLVLEQYVLLEAKVLLQGALNVLPDTYDFTTIMRDDLRVRGFIPVVEPYTALANFTHVNGGGGETVADPGTVFADYGNDSIVDWVFLELRDPADPLNVVATRAALVQRDGDIVDVDGVSPVVFGSSVAASYYVSVNHRNHLGTMIEVPIPLTAAGTVVDFTDIDIVLWDQATGQNYNGVEQFEILDGADLPTGKQALWAGDVAPAPVADLNRGTVGAVIFSGEFNDVDPVFNEIDSAPGNAFFRNKAYIYVGYHQGDANLNGETIFSGENNDVDLIFNNVDQHPRNSFFHNKAFRILEQIPTGP